MVAKAPAIAPLRIEAANSVKGDLLRKAHATTSNAPEGMINENARS